MKFLIILSLIFIIILNIINVLSSFRIKDDLAVSMSLVAIILQVLILNRLF